MNSLDVKLQCVLAALKANRRHRNFNLLQFLESSFLPVAQYEFCCHEITVMADFF